MYDDVREYRGFETKYGWQRELDQIIQKAKDLGHYREAIKYPNDKIPLSAALAYLDEHIARPEIMTALSNVGLREQIHDADADLWIEFKTFLRLRQPTSPDRSPYMGIYARLLACKEYSGTSDPRLIERLLLKTTKIYDDRNAN